MSTYKIAYPNIPYHSDIPGTMHIGKAICIKGHIPSNVDQSSYIQINLLESDKMIPLHISIRFQYKVVVRNSLQFGVWETEEKDGPFPFHLGKGFMMKILVQSEGYEISVDGHHCWSFSHRLSYLKAVKLHIAGPVRIQDILYTHEKSKGQPGNWEPQPYSLKPVLNPGIPFCYPITGGIRCGMSILIVGKPLKKFHRFTLCLQNGQILIPPPDVALQIDACAFNSTVVRNTRRNQMWEDEETAAPYFPFKPEKVFTLTISVQNDKYVIGIDGHNIIDYYHRMTRFSLINTLKIDNDVSIHSIHFQGTEK